RLSLWPSPRSMRGTSGLPRPCAPPCWMNWRPQHTHAAGAVLSHVAVQPHQQWEAASPKHTGCLSRCAVWYSLCAPYPVSCPSCIAEERRFSLVRAEVTMYCFSAIGGACLPALTLSIHSDNARDEKAALSPNH